MYIYCTKIFYVLKEPVPNTEYFTTVTHKVERYFVEFHLYTQFFALYWHSHCSRTLRCEILKNVRNTTKSINA